MIVRDIMNSSLPSTAHKPLPPRHVGNTFDTIQELQQWLEARDVPLSQWGVRDRKTIYDLWTELNRGETVLADDPPHRRLHVAQVIIRRGDDILIEVEQEFQRGGRRRRERPPAEKMRPGESVVEAAVRCLEEELGVTADDVNVLVETYRQVSHEGSSQSYPGLRSRWHFHRIEAEVAGLPSTNFVTEESDSNPTDPIRRHFWAWRPEALDVP